MEWQKAFGGSYDETGHYVHEKTEGGFMLAGSTESFGQGLFDIWVISTDYTGNEIYSQTFGSSMDDKALKGAKSENGALLVVGYTESFGNGPTFGFHNGSFGAVIANDGSVSADTV